MTPARLTECRALLGWTKLHLATLIGVNESLVRQMEQGKVAIQNDIAVWLETLAHFHTQFPPPVWERTRGRKKEEK